ncbi:hypothetical protein ARMSODRAFT_637312 [Armillaria solidipes]|uniref:Uncharacterized protein n=1 Tax=Armillaria solidipes TaxID=1076256 RepID=A0A2H3BRN3_9AGAR|nr:hypothetical protein ARMSODRAFT_637312 [Armillaria solidipes]
MTTALIQLDRSMQNDQNSFQLYALQSVSYLSLKIRLKGTQRRKCMLYFSTFHPTIPCMSLLLYLEIILGATNNLLIFHLRHLNLHFELSSLRNVGIMR